MNAAPGARLLHYEIGASIGKGGMGEVFRASDKRLGRDVAIKVLPEEFTKDAERLARFEREARVLASLSHPHIASIYGFEEFEGARFLVMELAQGEDLSARIARGAIAVDDATAIAIQIAEALEAAHEKGVVHRDLKPANIKVGDEGQVKILDFGLAKALETEEGSEDFSNSPTMVRAATHAGMILGTAAYMSPEQARGKKVDKRADIWAFGVVLWEMLTGRRLFAGDTVSDTLASVLKEEPAWDQLPDNIPPAIRRVLRRCLVKNPGKRLRDIGDVLVELQDHGSADAAAPAIGTPPSRKGKMITAAPWIVAITALALLAIVAGTRKKDSSRLPLRKLSIVPITQTRAFDGPLLSPDGARVAYLNGDAIWIRELDHQSPRRIADSRGAMRSTFFWSPDSRWLGFVSEDKLWKAPVDGAAPTPICDIPAESRSIAGAWGNGDRIVLAKWRGGLLEVSARGGRLRELMPAPKELVDYHALSFLPDGETLLASPHLVDDSNQTTVDVIQGGKRTKTLILSKDFRGGDASYAPSGHIVFSRGGGDAGVWAVPFSLKTLSITGESFVVDPEASFASVAADGSMAYALNLNQSPGQLVRVGWDGTIAGTIGAPAEDLDSPLFSPDGRTLAYSAKEKDKVNLWTLDVASGATRRLTFATGGDRPTAWTRDGKRILVGRWNSSWGSADNGLVIVDVGGLSGETRVGPGYSGSFLPDGSGVLYESFGIRNNNDLFVLRFSAGAKPEPFIVSPQSEGMPAISPDGKLVAYQSNETGDEEIFVARFPGAEGQRQVSQGGGRRPVWSRDGRAIFFRNGTKVCKIAVNGETFGAPEQLFDGAPQQLETTAGFDLLPDGSGLVMVNLLPLKDAAAVYVQNWYAEFAGR